MLKGASCDPEFRRIVSQCRDRLANLEGVVESIKPWNFEADCRSTRLAQGRYLRP
jgi:hypothetical protein